MQNICAVIICIIEVLVIAFYFEKIKLFKINANNKQKERIQREQTELTIGNVNITGNRGRLIGFVIATLGGFLGTSFFVLRDVSNFANFLKLNILFGILFTAAIVDFKWKIIPNTLVGFGVFFRIIIYIVEYFFYRETFIPQIKTDFIGFVLGFGFFLIASILSRGALGFGDVKIFGVIGIFSGAICTYATMIFCLLISTVVSIILLVTKKKHRRDTIPFGPCIFAGYWVALILSSY